MGLMFCHALVIRRCGCCGGLPFVSGCVCSQEYEGVKWRRGPGGHAIWLLCLECHHQKWPQDNRFRRVGVTHRIGKGFMMRMCFRMCSAFVQGLSQLRDVADVIVAGWAQQKSLFEAKGAHRISAASEKRQGDEGRRSLVLPHL